MVPSKLVDLRDVPLAEMPILSTVTLDEALGCVILTLRRPWRPRHSSLLSEPPGLT